jgi:beta-hydroxylase
MDQKDVAYRRRIDRLIATALDGPASSLFTDHEPFLRNFLCKYPGQESALHLHQDWMYVDERGGDRTFVVWIALDDIDGHNGQLRVARGSHLLDGRLRGSGLTAPWLEFEEVWEPRLLSVPVTAGEAVVFDNAVVHSSFPNLTDRPRLAVGLGFRPRRSRLVHFHRLDDHRAARIDVDADFFCTVDARAAAVSPLPELDVAETVEVIGLADDRPSPSELASELDGGLLARVDVLRHRARSRASGVREVAGRKARGSVAAVGTRLRSWQEMTASAWTGGLPALRSFVADLPSRAAVAVLGANEAAIRKFGPPTVAVWDPRAFPWSHDVEAHWAEVRAEVDSLLSGPRDIPHIEDVTGGIPQGNEGPWRSFVLMHQGRWIDWNCERCPRTTELVRSIPGLTMAGFSVLEPGTHITEHRGPNKGALRYQLGVVVPGDEGDCRIRVGDEMLVWREGEGVAFDFTVPHEAWNDSDGVRVLLMLEVLTPLPWYLDRPNRIAQRAMGWFPTTRDIRRRLAALEPTLLRDGRAAA